MNLDQELTDALKRKQPPPGMVVRVMAKIDSREAAPAAPSFWHAHGAGLRLAAGLMVIVAIGFGVVRQREALRERQEGEFATRKLMTALQIASEALNDAKRVVEQ